MSQEGSNNGRSIERMPPQAVEVEQAVLGAMFIDQSAIGRSIEVLDESCFYDARHGKIYRAIVALYERNEAVDQLTVGEELKRRSQLEEVGGVVYLATLATEVATAANIDYHARIVLEKSLSRKLIETAGEITEQAYEGSERIHELIDWAEQKVFGLAERQLNQGFEQLESVLGETLEQVERAHNQDSTVSGVETGFDDLNQLTSGFQKGDLIILAARPSVGKTALALSLALNAAQGANLGVAVFSLEMAKMQVAQRLLCIETRLDLHKLRTGRLRDEDWMNLTRSIGRLAQVPIYIDDTAGISVLEARAKARRLQRDKGIGLVVVDYLQLMSSHERLNSREQEISHISRSLKGLAKELDVPVLALSQLSRAVESRTDRRPQLSDLRESGCLSGATLVARADTGERLPIREFMDVSAASVWALNQATNKLEEAPVSDAFCTGIKPVYRLITRCGRTIRATANHKFLALEGWQRLDGLHKGQRIALPGESAPLADGAIRWDEIVAIEGAGEEEVYDLTVPRHHNFVADDIIVHNSIEQDADVVMFIYRPDIYGLKSAEGGSLEGMAEVIIGKQRNGPTGSAHLMWNAECASYENMAPEWRVEEDEEGEGF